MLNGNGMSTAKWVATVVVVIIFAMTVAFGAVQASMNAQLNSRIEKVDRNAEEISGIKSELRALTGVLNERFKNLDEKLTGINASIDRLAN